MRAHRAWGGRQARAIGLFAALFLASAPGCQTFSRKQAEARYAPSEGILETVAVLRRHVPDDTYRFPPATDFTGRNVYRASLLRLESLERAEADAIRSGYMDPVLAFAKARAMERLRAYDLAAGFYREAARLPGELREPALWSAAICERIAKAVAVGLDLADPLGDAGLEPLPLDSPTVLLELDDRIDRLSSILADVGESHYRWIVQEEIERADVIRGHYFVEMRFALADGNLIALQELQRVAMRHGASKNRLRHLLRLADFYVELSEEYLAAIPAESIDFDPARFRELSDAAIQLYELVASHDGHPAKLEAARSLEAFLALTLSIDADRFDR
ncbi:MAG: hypothetical protein JRG86_14260 [Deltaproteobacteria bacterium]|nr:hypothetical protein [Deltaproteobacteria bacterium]MBW2500930.1 hypothetical protein [Deltaproteobacteria bacterium]